MLSSVSAFGTLRAVSLWDFGICLGFAPRLVAFDMALDRYCAFLGLGVVLYLICTFAAFVLDNSHLAFPVVPLHDSDYSAAAPI